MYWTHLGEKIVSLDVVAAWRWNEEQRRMGREGGIGAATTAVATASGGCACRRRRLLRVQPPPALGVAAVTAATSGRSRHRSLQRDGVRIRRKDWNEFRYLENVEVELDFVRDCVMLINVLEGINFSYQ